MHNEYPLLTGRSPCPLFAIMCQEKAFSNRAFKFMTFLLYIDIKEFIRYVTNSSSSYIQKLVITVILSCPLCSGLLGIDAYENLHNLQRLILSLMSVVVSEILSLDKRLLSLGFWFGFVNFPKNMLSNKELVPNYSCKNMYVG